ncbi:MAG TPA: hypothetical protein VK797_02210 [Tepidisphaeraceae bacterium]|jgi:hypothetical protein|nr:hypothetical protein [Tepidisphaeraceae bacterium]
MLPPIVIVFRDFPTGADGTRSVPATVAPALVAGTLRVPSHLTMRETGKRDLIKQTISRIRRLAS